MWVVQPFPLFSSSAAGQMSVVKTILQVLLHAESEADCVGDFDPLFDAYEFNISGA